MSLASRNVTRGVALTMVLYASLSFSSADLQARNIPGGEFLTKLNRFFKDYCFECHNQEHAEGEFRIEEELLRDFQSTQARSKWREIINVLKSHEMPPADAKQPRASDVAVVVDWATNQIMQQERELRKNAVVMWRPNRIEYQKTMRELTGIDYDVSHFPLDPSASGFDNVGSALSLSSMQIEMYLEAAQTVLDEALDLSERPEPIRWRFEIKRVQVARDDPRDRS